MAAPPTNHMTPEVARVHYDDLRREFRVCISFQLQTPLGNLPHQEVCIDAADLASVLQQIVNIWANIAFLDDGTAVNAPLGSPDVLLAYFRDHYASVPVALLDAPASPDNNTGPDDDITIYTGDYGIVVGP